MLAMKSAAVLLLALSICSGFAQEGSLKLTHTIPLNGIQSRFDHFAIDAKGQRLFLAALGNNSLKVIDLAIQHRAVNDSMRKTGSTLLVQHPVLGRLPANAALHA